MLFFFSIFYETKPCLSFASNFLPGARKGRAYGSLVVRFQSPHYHNAMSEYARSSGFLGSRRLCMSLSLMILKCIDWQSLKMGENESKEELVAEACKSCGKKEALRKLTRISEIAKTEHQRKASWGLQITARYSITCAGLEG